MKILVELEFDENELGPKWMNPDNLDLLLYSYGFSTNRELLKVVSYKEIASDSIELPIEAEAKSRCKGHPAGHILEADYCKYCGGYKGPA